MPNVILESNWSAERGLNNCLALQEVGAPFIKSSLIPADSIISVQSSVRLFDDSSHSNGSSKQCLELSLVVVDETCLLTGFSVISEVPMFEVYSGVHSEYLGTFGGYILDDVQEIVSYRVDVQLPSKVRNKAVLKFSPKPGRHSLWLFGMVALYENTLPEAGAAPIDVSHVVSLVAGGRRKPASDTDMSLMTKLCEIFNSSMGNTGGGPDRARQRSRESLGHHSQSPHTQNGARDDRDPPPSHSGDSLPTPPAPSPGPGSAPAPGNRAAALALEFDAFRERVEAQLSEHSHRLSLVCEAVLSKVSLLPPPPAPPPSATTTVSPAPAPRIHPPLQSLFSPVVGELPPLSLPAASPGGASDVQRLAADLRAFQADVYQRLHNVDDKLDAILHLLKTRDSS